MTHLRSVVMLIAAAALLCSSGCERLFDKGSKQDIQAADKKLAAGDLPAAIRLYEASFDGTAKTADIHYKLGSIYADKLKQPLDALHHFDRYLDLAPNGTFSKEAKAYKKEGQQKLLLAMTNGSPASQDEAVRLKNENLSLKKALTELKAQKSATPVPLPAGAKKGEQVQKPIPTGARTHVVANGETLGSIATKYYKNKGRWKDIQDANFYSLEGTAKIKPGMTLIIP